MKTWSFTAIISPRPGFSMEALADRLCEAGCDDATLSFQGGVWSLDFDREAKDMGVAVRHALLDIRQSRCCSVIRFEGPAGPHLLWSMTHEPDPHRRAEMALLADKIAEVEKKGAYDAAAPLRLGSMAWGGWGMKVVNTRLPWHRALVRLVNSLPGGPAVWTVSPGGIPEGFRYRTPGATSIEGSIMAAADGSFMSFVISSAWFAKGQRWQYRQGIDHVDSPNGRERLRKYLEKMP